MTDEPKPVTLREAAEAVVSQLTQDLYHWKVALSPPDFNALEELRDALRRDAEERAEIVEVLREAEHGQCGHGSAECPVCDEERPRHVSGCRLAALLARLEER